MVVINNWMRLAAADICEATDIHDVREIEAILERHCPFERDTAYIAINTGVVAQMAQGVEELLRVCTFVSNTRLSEVNPALRDAVVALRVLMEKNKVVLQCTQCGKRTIPLEAAQRNGCCDVCGGFFVVTLD